jgi:hypothetical protein
MSDPIQPPKQSKGDIAHIATKAGLSAIPVLGGPAAELFQLVVQPPLERRRVEWMKTVGEKLQELEENGLRLDQLSENEEFITAAMHASQIVLRSHQSEKLEALRNAVLNIATGQAPAEALQHMFFRLVDSFSPLHLRILILFQAPTPPPQMSMGGLSDVLVHNMPELHGQDHIYTQVWKDLYSSGLLNTNGMNITMSGHGLGEKRTTELGDQFLHFISDPTSTSPL